MKTRPIQWVTLIFITLLLGACATSFEEKSEKFYADHPDVAKQIVKDWGQPMAVEEMENGYEKWIYKIDNPWPVEMAYRYFIIKDGRVLYSGLTDQGKTKINAEFADTDRFSSGKLSHEFYEKHHRKADQMLKAWGDPVDVIKLENGTEKRIYEFENQFTGTAYRYFIIDADGNVVASGMSDTLPAAQNKNQHLFKGFEVVECSDKFYQKHPQSTQKLQQDWGKPLVVEKFEDNLEKWIYEYPNFVTGIAYRFFIVQNGMVKCSGITDTLKAAEE